MQMNRLRVPATAISAAIVAVLVSAAVAAQDGRPVRTFPQFAGTWVLDEAASTGRLLLAPRIPTSMTIEITPAEIIVTKQPRFHELDRNRNPPPERYQLDGTETPLVDGRTGVSLQISHRFTLVADMLALTVKTFRPGGGFTLVTDAYAVEGDALTLHRQLSSITAAGEILVMQEPTNNLRHTFVYRRVAGAAPE